MIESHIAGYFFGTRKSLAYNNDNIYITDKEVDILSFKINSPGLSEDPNTISLQSTEDDRYVTVATRDGVLELKDIGEMSGGWQNGIWKEGESYFHQAATFQKVEDKFFEVIRFIFCFKSTRIRGIKVLNPNEY